MCRQTGIHNPHSTAVGLPHPPMVVPCTLCTVREPPRTDASAVPSGRFVTAGCRPKNHYFLPAATQLGRKGKQRCTSEAALVGNRSRPGGKQHRRGAAVDTPAAGPLPLVPPSFITEHRAPRPGHPSAGDTRHRRLRRAA